MNPDNHQDDDRLDSFLAATSHTKQNSLQQSKLFVRRRKSHESQEAKPGPYSRFLKSSQDGQKTCRKPVQIKAETSKPTRSRTASKENRCSFCLDTVTCISSRELTFLAASESVYLAAHLVKDTLLPFHAFLCPVAHVPDACCLDSSALADIAQFKNALTRFFNGFRSPLLDASNYSSLDGPYVPIFLEWKLTRELTEWERCATHALGRGPHLTIDVLPLRSKDIEKAKGIFKHEFRNMGDSIARTNRGFRKIRSSVPISAVVPSNNPPNYIYVDFGDEAYLHTLDEGDAAGINLREKVDRKFMKSLMRSLYPSELLAMNPEVDEGLYYKSFRSSFAPYDFNS